MNSEQPETSVSRVSSPGNFATSAPGTVLTPNGVVKRGAKMLTSKTTAIRYRLLAGQPEITDPHDILLRDVVVKSPEDKELLYCLHKLLYKLDSSKQRKQRLEETEKEFVLWRTFTRARGWKTPSATPHERKAKMRGLLAVEWSKRLQVVKVRSARIKSARIDRRSKVKRYHEAKVASNLSRDGLKLRFLMSTGSKADFDRDYKGYTMPNCGPYALGNPSDNTCPWIRGKSYLQKDGISRLSAEINDMCQYLLPTRLELLIRQNLVNRYVRFLEWKIPGSTVHCVGSSSWDGAFLPTSDVDLVIIPHQDKDSAPIRHYPAQAIAILDMLAEELTQASMTPEKPEVIGYGIPIISLEDTITHLNVDISYNLTTGIKAKQLIARWQKRWGKYLTHIMLAMKQFLKMRGLSKVFTGGIGSYALTIMIGAYLDLKHPELRTEIPPMNRNLNKAGQGVNNNFTGEKKQLPELADVFLGFLKFFGEEFDMYKSALKAEPGAVVPKKPWKAYWKLCITDPLDEENDLGSKSFGYKHIQETMLYAYKRLTHDAANYTKRHQHPKKAMSAEEAKYMEQDTLPSGILGSVFAGNYTEFERSRADTQRRFMEYASQFNRGGEGRHSGNTQSWDIA
ncbi:Non-canonical poly(A) RNA polymerase papd5 [Rhizina undulata]